MAEQGLRFELVGTIGSNPYDGEKVISRSVKVVGPGYTRYFKVKAFSDGPFAELKATQECDVVQITGSGIKPEVYEKKGSGEHAAAVVLFADTVEKV